MASDTLSVVICDAGPIIHLDELRSLDLLRTFQEILVPYPVWEEVQRHRPSALRRRKVSLKRIDNISQPTAELFRLFQTFAIDAGEAAAFRLLQQFSAATLLTDDAAARLLAVSLGYDVHGTIGVLIRGLAERLRTKRQTLNLLRSIREKSTLHLAAGFLNQVIERVRESTP